MNYIYVYVCNFIINIRILTTNTFLNIIKTSSSFFSSFNLQLQFNQIKIDQPTNECKYELPSNYEFDNDFDNDWGWFVEFEDDYKKINL